jgi:hypothetical protein
VDAHPLIPLQQYRIWQWVNTVMEQPKMATSKTKIMFGAAGFRFHMVSWKKRSVIRIRKWWIIRCEWIYFRLHYKEVFFQQSTLHGEGNILIEHDLTTEI